MMQACVYAHFQWTPETFWNLSMYEFIAAMTGLRLLNSSTEDKTQRQKGKLTSKEVNRLKELLSPNEDSGV